jgi:hypothetical protein
MNHNDTSYNRFLYKLVSEQNQKTITSKNRLDYFMSSNKKTLTRKE